MAALLAEDFESAEGRDKAAMRNFLDGLVVQGYLSNVDMVLDDTEVVIVGGRPAAYPVRITDPFLSKEGIAVEVTLARRDGHWLIVRTRQEGGRLLTRRAWRT